MCVVNMGVFRLSKKEVRVFNIGDFDLSVSAICGLVISVLGIGMLGMSVLGLIDWV